MDGQSKLIHNMIMNGGRKPRPARNENQLDSSFRRSHEMNEINLGGGKGGAPQGSAEANLVGVCFAAQMNSINLIFKPGC